MFAILLPYLKLSQYNLKLKEAMTTTLMRRNIQSTSKKKTKKTVISFLSLESSHIKRQVLPEGRTREEESKGWQI